MAQFTPAGSILHVFAPTLVPVPFTIHEIPSADPAVRQKISAELWSLTTDGLITVGTTSLTFASLGGAIVSYGTKALPLTNVGAIWSDTFNSIMTWQSFTANGAAYTGYASVNVGGLLLDTQPTARLGYVKSGVSNVSRTAYAALRGWALHNGVLVASGTWAAGAFVFKDNIDGTTFTVADVRGEFPRFWDDGRGADSGRVLGSAQLDALQGHRHSYP